MTLKNLLSLFSLIFLLQSPIYCTQIIILLLYIILFQEFFLPINRIYKKSYINLNCKLHQIFFNVNVEFFNENAILSHRVLYHEEEEESKVWFHSTAKTLKYGIECMSYFKHINYFAIKLYVLCVFQWFATQWTNLFN